MVISCSFRQRQAYLRHLDIRFAFHVFILLVVIFANQDPQSSTAHPISMSTVVVNVQETSATAELTIMLEDLVLYHELKANKKFLYPAKELEAAAEKHQANLLNWFVLRGTNGQRIPGHIVLTNTEGIPAAGTPQAELMARSIHYEIDFPFESSHDFLTFTQEFGGAGADLPAIMDFQIQQAGILVEAPTQLLPSRPHTVRFDWKNPPKTPPKSWRELAQKKARQFHERLGITSYSGLYSFIYVTRFEVRHEILVPLLTLESWLTVAREDPDFLSVEEQQMARESISRFFCDMAPLSINGVAVQPRLSRLNFFGLDINDFARNAKPRRVSAYQARVGIILSYEVNEPPRKVDMRWDTFNQHAAFLRSIIYVYDEKPFPHFFVKGQEELHWQGKPPATKSLISVSPSLLSNTATIDDRSADDCGKIVIALLQNVYQAFAEREDSQVYDVLAVSVDGELLNTLYLQFKRSLLMSEQGGSLSHVGKVSFVDGEVLLSAADREFSYRCRWNVHGRVEHWGHIHSRTNQNEARFVIGFKAGRWKIVSFQVTDQKRLAFETKLRMVTP
ncbi:MAG: hypothetical protein MK165_12195 [Pirellulaceae bacterium]|nr:hypothetical protein [Pirellulaceae bacterium]